MSLDYNCFQRGFDDLRQVRIQMESLACRALFIKAEEDQIQLIWSFMHEDETMLCPFPERKYEALRLADLCKIRIGPKEEIYELAKVFQKKSGFSAKDAIHVACAFYAKADHFLTCDDKLVSQSRKLNIETEIINPVEYGIRSNLWKKLGI